MTWCWIIGCMYLLSVLGEGVCKEDNGWTRCIQGLFGFENKENKYRIVRHRR